MKTKILFLLPRFRKGGEVKNTLNILNALDTDCFDLTLLICKKGENDYRHLLEKKIRFIEIESKTPIWAFYHIIKTLHSIRPDITFTSFIDLNFIVGIYKVLTFRKIVSVLRFNTMPSSTISADLGFPVTRKIKKESVRSATRILAQSFEMRDEIMKYYPKYKNKVEVIPNIINRGQIIKLANEYIPFESSTGTTLVAVGNLWVAKGFEFLIRAVEKLKNDNNLSVRLFIIGENIVHNSDYDLYLKNLIKDLNLENEVFLEGYKINPYPYMKHADVFVLSSLKEGFPNVVLEALTLRIPCVVTDCVDFSSIIKSGSNGYIVEKASVNSLVHGLLKVKNINFRTEQTVDFDFNKWILSIAIC